MNERALIIANPNAAAGRVGAQWDEIMGSVRHHLGEVEAVRTASQGDAIRLACEAVERGVTRLLSMGGDGTHNEVVNGIMAAEPEAGAIALGILPAGTGGDFRRLLRGGLDIETSAQALAEASEHAVDLVHVDYKTDDGRDESRYYLNMASFGMGGLICRVANTSSKRLGGKTTFFLATVRASMKYRTPIVRVVVDGVHAGDHPVSNVMVANGQYSGGGMWIAPMARIADGLLDVLIIEKGDLITEARLLRKVYRGEHTAHPKVTPLRGREVRLESLNGKPAYIDLDGEAPGIIPATIKVVPGAIRLLNPLPDAL